ncbi:hypothetical protein BC629DRAFT_246306 [Irpex lacteus]|nr:hypothetical protein BC629DRAFT_246306 [Irpex lacteus]
MKFAQEMASLHGDLHPPEIETVTSDCITPRIGIQKDSSVVEDDSESPRVSLDDHSVSHRVTEVNQFSNSIHPQAQPAVGPYDWEMASDAGQDTDNLDESLDCGKFSEVEDEPATTAAEDRAALVDLASHPTALLDVNPRRTTNAGFPGPSLPNVDPFAQTSGLSEVPFNDTKRCNVRGTSTSFEQRGIHLIQSFYIYVVELTQIIPCSPGFTSNYVSYYLQGLFL